ncbi:conserved hypothetical protein [Azospirillaceae bacterium]|nr:hypothetical protein MTCCP1_00043 [uncultured bacterium]
MVATPIGAGLVGGKALAAKGISHETIRQALIAKGVAPATAAAFPGIEHEVVRDALVAKAIGGTGAIGGAGTGIVAGKSALAATPAAQALTTGGTLCKSFSLGLGLGLGAWGPILVGIAGAVVAYSVLRYRQRQKGAELALEEEITDEGFLKT